MNYVFYILIGILVGRVAAIMAVYIPPEEMLTTIQTTLHWGYRICSGVYMLMIAATAARILWHPSEPYLMRSKIALIGTPLFITAIMLISYYLDHNFAKILSYMT